MFLNEVPLIPIDDIGFVNYKPLIGLHTCYYARYCKYGKVSL